MPRGRRDVVRPGAGDDLRQRLRVDAEHDDVEREGGASHGVAQGPAEPRVAVQPREAELELVAVRDDDALDVADEDAAGGREGGGEAAKELAYRRLGAGVAGRRSRDRTAVPENTSGWAPPAR